MSESERIEVDATTAGVRQALDAVEAFSTRGGVDDGVRRRVLTALDDVLSNIVRHGGDAVPADIVILASSGPEGFVLDVSDSATAFNPLLAPQPDTTLPLDRRRPGGLGIVLVRGLSDDVRYDRREGRNHVTMTWREAPGGDE
ncbi:MAG TPA: ATP-binding protein [Vicinamibacterales bacterium]|nr:ATP-binding protein [Vicinamibacterales bacterium]